MENLFKKHPISSNIDAFRTIALVKPLSKFSSDFFWRRGTDEERKSGDGGNDIGTTIDGDDGGTNGENNDVNGSLHNDTYFFSPCLEVGEIHNYQYAGKYFAVWLANDD